MYVIEINLAIHKDIFETKEEKEILKGMAQLSTINIAGTDKEEQ